MTTPIRFYIAFKDTNNEQIYDSLLKMVVWTKYERQIIDCMIDITDRTWRPV